MIFLLVLAGIATVVALLAPRSAPWSWTGAVCLVSAWVVAVAGPAAGLPLIGGAFGAGALDRSGAPAGRGFEDLVGRIAALLLGVAAGVLVVVRVLQADVAGGAEVFLLLAIGLAAAVHAMLQPGHREQVRAARLGLTVAAAGWAAGGHAGATTAMAAAVLLVVLAVPRTMPQGRES
ncbi:MAG: hypothetical protein ABR573_10705 [Candidatus Dormibacteria bacterium]